jgi:hypothetical protein
MIRRRARGLSTSLPGAGGRWRRHRRADRLRVARPPRHRRRRRRCRCGTDGGQDRPLCASSRTPGGKFARSLLEVDGAALVVSQFTLLADTRKGNRPSFTDAARPEYAEPLYERFCADLAALGVRVERGAFGARMAVELVNDGPVTILLD